jgi:hypothetical protein
MVTNNSDTPVDVVVCDQFSGKGAVAERERERERERARRTRVDGRDS